MRLILSCVSGAGRLPSANARSGSGRRPLPVPAPCRFRFQVRSHLLHTPPTGGCELESQTYRGAGTGTYPFGVKDLI
jgi:hypothetical protein